MSASSTRMVKMKRKSSMLRPDTSTPINSKTKDFIPPSPPLISKQSHRRSSSKLFNIGEEIRVSRKNTSANDLLDELDEEQNLSRDEEETQFGVDRGKSFEELEKSYATLKTQHEELQNKYEDLEGRQNDLQSSLNDLLEKVSKKKKNSVTPRKEIRNFVRIAYQQNECEWSFRKSDSPFNSGNSPVTEKVKENVKGLDSSATDEEINCAISTYYTSIRGYKLKKKKNPEAVNLAARYQRKQHKLKRRLKALDAKTSITDAKKEKIRRMMVLDLMSSEDEDKDDKRCFVIRPLKWRSRKMNNLIDALDHKTETTQSRASERQTNTRIVGEDSTRNCPEKILNCPDFAWAISLSQNDDQ